MTESPTISWEWIAGFFEGEGHIYWQEGRHGTKSAMGSRLILGQKDKRPLQAIYDFLLLNKFKLPQFYLRPQAKDPRSTPCWILTVSNRDDVIRYINGIRPWLFQKADKADMVRARLQQAINDRDLILEKALAMKQAGIPWGEISRLLRIGRMGLRNYATSKGINLSRLPGFESSAAWRKDRVDRGLCAQCGKSRGESLSKNLCISCVDKRAYRLSEHRRIFGRNKLTPMERIKRMEIELALLQQCHG